MRKFLIAVVIILFLSISSGVHALDVALRLGQGGLRDDRAPDGILGGGQLAIDVKPLEYPIAISLSGEYHKKDPVADHPYEIDSLTAFNLLYMATVARKRAGEKPFVYAVGYLGGGTGWLAVPRIEDPDDMEQGILFDLVCGINIRIYWKIGLYVEGKYVYSSKTTGGVKVIDFSDVGGMVGISFNSGW